MISTGTTHDPVVDFLSDQLKVHSRTLLSLVQRHRDAPYSVAMKDISTESLRARHTFMLTKTAAERSRHTISSDSCFGQALMEYIRASSQAREALSNPAEAA